MHVSLVYRWLIGTRCSHIFLIFWRCCTFLLHLKGTNVQRIVQPLWHNKLTSSLKTHDSLPWDPTFASCCPDLISHLEPMGVGGRSPGSALSKLTKQWTHPVFPSKYSTCEYMDHEDAEFAMAMEDYRRVHRMTEIVFDRTGFNKHLALSPKGLLFGSWTCTCIVRWCVDGER